MPALYSDNEARVDGRAGTALELGLRLDIERSVGRLLANIDGDVALHDYQGGVLDRQLQGYLSANVRYAFVPERVEWVVEDYFGQSLIRQEVIDAPDNRQYFNFIGTGPNVTIPLTLRTFLDGEARWSKAHYSESIDINSTRSSAQLGIRRRLGEIVELALTGSFQKVSYDQSIIGVDFETKSLFAEGTARGAKTDLSLRGGATRLSRGNITTSEPLFSVSVFRDLSQRSRVGLEGGERVSDNAESYMREQDFTRVGIGLIPDAVAAGAFRSRFADAVISIAGLRNKLDLHYTWQRELYFVSDRADRERTGPVLRFTRQIGTNVAFNIHGLYWRDKFMGVSPDSDESNIGVGVDWNLAHATTLSVAVDHHTGNGEALTGIDRISYSDNQIILRFSRLLGQ